jgi:tripartite-type tricarboxylate transporter receptor subunit TctC
MHNTGKQRILAVTSDTRLESAPNIPTVAEAGMPGLAATQFLGLFAPRGTPKAIIEQIAQAARQTMADKELQRMFVAAGFEPELDASPENTRRILDAELVKWTPVIRSIGLKLD